jgi:peptidoglycan L-alanyl-D-glutamate endopeptidase CwlK
VSYRLGSTSLSRLGGVHPLLVGCVVRAIRVTSVDFTVFEGVRSMDRQVELVRSGRSKTMDSRHLVGKAVDLPSWHGYPKWDRIDAQQIANAMFQSAKECGVTLRWGGDWNMNGDQTDESFRDLVHFELPISVYG